MVRLPYSVSSYFTAQGYDQEDAIEAFQLYEQSLVVGTVKLTRLTQGTSNDDGDKFIDIKGISDHLLSHALMAKWKRFIAALSSLPDTMGPFVTLHLDDVTLDGYVADMLLDVLKDAPIARLLLQTCHNGLKFGSNVLEVNSTLEALGIRGGRFESIYSAIGFAKNIMNHPQLSFLTIEKSDIIADNAAFEAIIPALGRIHTVTLTQNRIGSDGATIIANFLATNPEAGIALGGGLRKVRVAREGGGKSGGYRTIYVFGGTHMPLFLLTVFAKNEKDNLTRSEQAAAVDLAKRLIAAFGDKQ